MSLKSEVLIQRQTYTVAEAAQILGISRTLAYELIRQGQLPVARLNRRIVIPVARLEKWLNNGSLSCEDERK